VASGKEESPRSEVSKTVTIDESDVAELVDGSGVKFVPRQRT